MTRIIVPHLYQFLRFQVQNRKIPVPYLYQFLRQVQQIIMEMLTEQICPYQLTIAKKVLIQQKKGLFRYEKDLFTVVVPPGFEPGTQGFSVLCSTD